MATMISYRGHGWLSFLILFGIPWPLVGVLLMIGLPMPVAAAGGFSVGAITNHLVGSRLNSTVTPQGRWFHNRHEFMGAPMQNTSWFVGGVAFLLVGAAVAGKGGETAGHTFFYIALAGWLVALVIVMNRRRRVHRVQLSAEAMLAGGDMAVEVDGRRIEFHVPAGIGSGDLVRAPGQGPDGRDVSLRVILRG